MSKRIEWIDIARFLVIFIMVWAHVGMYPLLDAYIHVFHMPIFFFISGCFYKPEKYENLGSIIKKRGKVLIIPYFSFGIILYVFWTLFYYSSGMVEEIVSVSTFLNSLFWANTTIIPYSAVQWFITCLFLTEILFYFIHKFSKTKIQLLFFLVISGLIGYIYPIFTDARLPWGLDVAFSAIVFYGAGYLVKNYGAQTGKSLITEPKLIYLILIPLLTLPTIYLNGTVNMRRVWYGNGLLFYFNAFAMIYFILLFSKYVEKIKALKQTEIYNYALYLGKNTIIILLTHRIFDRAFKIILSQVLESSNTITTSLIYFGMTLLIMLLMIPVSNMVNKHLYFLLGRNSTTVRTRVRKN